MILVKGSFDTHPHPRQSGCDPQVQNHQFRRAKQISTFHHIFGEPKALMTRQAILALSSHPTDSDPHWSLKTFSPDYFGLLGQNCLKICQNADYLALVWPDTPFPTSPQVVAMLLVLSPRTTLLSQGKTSPKWPLPATTPSIPLSWPVALSILLVLGEHPRTKKGWARVRVLSVTMILGSRIPSVLASYHH